MSVEFIQSKKGNSSINLAIRQQEQISYFTQSQIQEQVTEAYLKAWVEKKYQSSDYFLNWVQSVFKHDNFMSFVKYYRHPNPASKLINNKIKEPLSRVFFSEDSYFKYNINGIDVDGPKEIEKDINDLLFKALLFNHNSVMIHDLSGINESYRYIVDINKIIAIESENNIIQQIAFTAQIVINEKAIDGYLYLNDTDYIFYEKGFNKDGIKYPHDLGICPADYISREAFGNDDIVRKSIFSYVREELEEYVFLKTLQRMTEPNGALPIVTKIKSKTKDGKDIGEKKQPMSASTIAGQKPIHQKTSQGEESILQAGNIISVPAVKKVDGSYDVELAKNFINFFYIPVESLEYLSKRIKEIEVSIITSVLGDYTEVNEAAKNEKQVSKSFVSKEDILRGLSLSLSRIRERSDYKLLALKYGPDRVIVEVFFGSDFFLETTQELYEMFKVAPNGIERRDIINRIAQSRNKFNKDKASRQMIQYKLLPYVSDDDFNKAVESLAVEPSIFQLQTRFTYWISLFEARYGDIVIFWNESKASESEKLIMINNLLLELINSNINLKKQENGN